MDIWNVIEAFRENGLNTLEPTNEVSVARLETLISSLYHNLNKRLPTNQQVPVDSKAGLLLNWLLSAYTSDNSGIRVFSIKVALAIMCAGKLVDKLRCENALTLIYLCAISYANISLCFLRPTQTFSHKFPTALANSSIGRQSILFGKFLRFRQLSTSRPHSDTRRASRMSCFRLRTKSR